eukprot:CAMPEP_0119030406 /NCGR_PEP_ID=MMETSP1176-20130426/41013_1 /TAXON_ID=265551 /ORGANISM="Synedropsis recta cf, Strain CCMP1620" /LENGTH=470 /DNA_ID=CAMNT_0006986775 /DNA_START=288 /DNA_END=1700 /DNA_ORIENTATION=-
MSTFTAPEELDAYQYYPHPYIIRGTIASCNFQGWLYQAGTAVPMYNSVLSIYYLLRVKYKVSDEDLRKHTLPAMHVFVLVFAFGTATIALVLQLYNFGGMLGCWISDGCTPGDELENCGRGSNHELFMWLFGGFPVLASLAVTIVTTAMLYCDVRSQEVIAHRRHSYEYDRHSRATSGRSRPDDGEAEALESSENEKISLWGCCRCWLERASERNKISAKVRDSGLLYVIAFWITYLPFLVIELCHLAGSDVPDWIRFANVTLLPLQGFFNIIIYKIPVWQYRRSRRQQARNLSSRVSTAGAARRAHLFTNSGARSGHQVSRDSSTVVRSAGDVPMIVHMSVHSPEPEEATVGIPLSDSLSVHSPEPEEADVEIPLSDSSSAHSPEPEEATVEIPLSDSPSVHSPEPEEATVEIPLSDSSSVHSPEPEEATVEIPLSDSSSVHSPEPEKATVEIPSSDSPSEPDDDVSLP